MGDYEDGVTLSDVLGLSPNILQNNGKRCNKELFQLPLKELFERISKALCHKKENEARILLLNPQGELLEISLKKGLFDKILM